MEAPDAGQVDADIGDIGDISDKSRLLLALLAFFFGFVGAHRFYAGKIGTAVAQLLTLGGLGIWAFIDFLIILFGEFTDASGRKVRDW